MNNGEAKRERNVEQFHILKYVISRVGTGVWVGGGIKESVGKVLSCLSLQATEKESFHQNP